MRAPDGADIRKAQEERNLERYGTRDYPGGHKGDGTLFDKPAVPMTKGGIKGSHPRVVILDEATGMTNEPTHEYPEWSPDD